MPAAVRLLARPIAPAPQVLLGARWAGVALLAIYTASAAIGFLLFNPTVAGS